MMSPAAPVTVTLKSSVSAAAFVMSISIPPAVALISSAAAVSSAALIVNTSAASSVMSPFAAPAAVTATDPSAVSNVKSSAVSRSMSSPELTTKSPSAPVKVTLKSSVSAAAFVMSISIPPAVAFMSIASAVESVDVTTICPAAFDVAIVIAPSAASEDPRFKPPEALMSRSSVEFVTISIPPTVELIKIESAAFAVDSKSSEDADSYRIVEATSSKSIVSVSAFSTISRSPSVSLSIVKPF